MEAGLSHRCDNRTVRRVLNDKGYFYLQARKKGMLSKADQKKRTKFARDVLAGGNNNLHFWSYTIAFFFDGTSFVHKTNPQDQAVSPKGRVWRKRSEGLSLGCTSKGAKAGYNGRVAHFFVAISHTKGVISCEQYTDVLTGELFADFVNGNFVDLFRSCKNPDSGMFLQDGDPRQNSKAAQTALQHLGMQCFSIPARSPDLNPIENLFHLVNNKLKTEALEQNIRKETFEEFSARVKLCIQRYTCIPFNGIHCILATVYMQF